MSKKRLVTVVASPGSGLMVQNATQFNDKLDGATRSPTGEVVEVGKYSGERFPRSHQIFRPTWSLAQSRWMVGDLSNKDLQEVVQAMNLTYETGSRNGEVIETANTRVFGDAFFNHRLLKLKFKEGEVMLNPDDVVDNFWLECMKGSVEFKAENETDGIKMAKGRYTIIDEEVAKGIEAEKMSDEVEAISLFSKMNFDKKRQIAYAMGSLVNDNMDPNDLDRVLYSTMKEPSSNLEGKTGFQAFIAYATLKPEELNLKYMVGRAIKKAVVRKQGRDYTLFGQKVGTTPSDIVQYLANPDNEMHLDMLRQELGD